jgi:hypothetical protein
LLRKLRNSTREFSNPAKTEAASFSLHTVPTYSTSARPEAVLPKSSEKQLCQDSNQACVNLFVGGFIMLESTGSAVLAVGRKNKGQFRIPEHWFKFIIATYEWGRKIAPG